MTQENINNFLSLRDAKRGYKYGFFGGAFTGIIGMSIIPHQEISLYVTVPIFDGVILGSTFSILFGVRPTRSVANYLISEVSQNITSLEVRRRMIFNDISTFIVDRIIKPEFYIK